jgi:hypothetical protein
VSTKGLSGGTWLALFIIVSLAAITGLVGWWVWTEVRDVQIGMHGWIALGLGVSVTSLLGIGLMALVWRSHHGGYDERAGHE